MFTIPQLIGIIPYILLVVYVFVFHKKLKGNVFISIIFGLIACELLLSLILFFIYNLEFLHDILFSIDGAYMLGGIAFYVALHLVVLGNQIPSVGIAWRKRKNDTDKNDPEFELCLLKYKFDLEIVTKEDYEAQRAEIIKKL